MLDRMANLFPGPAELQRPKGHLIKNGRIEELYVRVLKQERHAPSEPDHIFIVGQGSVIQFSAVEVHMPC